MHLPIGARVFGGAVMKMHANANSNPNTNASGIGV